MEFKQLEAFVAVVDYGSFSEAARDVYKRQRQRSINNTRNQPSWQIFLFKYAQEDRISDKHQCPSIHTYIS